MFFSKNKNFGFLFVLKCQTLALKHWKYWKNWETLRHWKHWATCQYIDMKTLNSIQCQCEKLKHWKATQCQCQCQFFQCFNVSLNVQCRFADP